MISKAENRDLGIVGYALGWALVLMVLMNEEKIYHTGACPRKL